MMTFVFIMTIHGDDDDCLKKKKNSKEKRWKIATKFFAENLLKKTIIKL